MAGGLGDVQVLADLAALARLGKPSLDVRPGLSTAADRDQFFDDLPARRKVDAVILVGVPVTEHQVERIGQMAVPVLMAGSLIEHYPCIHIDEVEAARQAVSHLTTLGHRRIARIGIIDPDGEPWQPDAGRDEGYRQALAAAGIEFDPDLTVRVDFSLGGGALAMDRLLSLEQPPSAVFAFSDEIAIGALRSLRRVGLRVPHDISVIGVDDHPMADLSDLTTVSQPVHEMGRRAAESVVDVLSARAVAENVVLPTRLIVRGSTSSPLRRS